MKKIGVAVLVSGGGTNLQAIIDAGKAGKLPSCELRAVISSRPDAYALERAAKAGIGSYTVSRKDCPSQEEFERRIAAVIDGAGAEIVVLAGFMCILSADFTRKYSGRIINVHPSLIPSFCGKGFYGLKVHEAALGYGVKVTGATVHFVNEIPDGGRIIMQKAVAVRKNDTPEILQKRVMKQAEWKILPASLELVCSELLEREEKENG